MNQEEINKILEEHKKWLLGGDGGKRANLRGDNLRGANLYGANLYEADLRGADLFEADLRGADLYGADLREANLYGANLRGADLQGANLRGANLRGANLRGANLRGAKNIPQNAIDETNILPAGKLIGWKKLLDEKMCKLQIPEKARRSNSTGRKCRCEYAKILEIWNKDQLINEGESIHDGTKYVIGNIVKCDKWKEDRWVECGGGIHFFITRGEAERYEV